MKAYSAEAITEFFFFSLLITLQQMQKAIMVNKGPSAPSSKL
jgi:hypothetical protein